MHLRYFGIPNGSNTNVFTFKDKNGYLQSNEAMRVAKIAFFKFSPQNYGSKYKALRINGR